MAEREIEYREWIDLYAAEINSFEISEEETHQITAKVDPIKLFTTYSSDPISAARRALRMAIPERNIKQKHPPPKFKLYMKREYTRGTESFTHESLQDLTAHGLREAIIEGVSIVGRRQDVEIAYVVPESAFSYIDPVEARMRFEQTMKES